MCSICDILLLSITLRKMFYIIAKFILNKLELEIVATNILCK